MILAALDEERHMKKAQLAEDQEVRRQMEDLEAEEEERRKQREKERATEGKTMLFGNIFTQSSAAQPRLQLKLYLDW